MPVDLIIRGGLVATPEGFRRTDLFVRREKILKLGRSKAAERRQARACLDAEGCLVLPGGIDPHVHFELSIGAGMRTVDDFAAGSRAALAGGVTSIIDYTGPGPGQGPRQAFEDRQAQARACNCDYGLHNVLIAWKPEWVEDLRWLKKRGNPSVKLFMIYKDRGWQAHDGMMHEVMRQCQRLGFTVCVHAENDALIDHFTAQSLALPREKRPGASALALSRPPLVEYEAVGRAIALAEDTGVHLHLVHLSTARSAQMVGQARRRGLRVSAETCPQYLGLDEKKLRGPEGHHWACCPPLRKAKERSGLWHSLAEGCLQAITTDHCNFDRGQKDSWGGNFQRIPYGLAGVETSMRLSWTLGVEKGLISRERWVELHSAGPARLFGLYPQKGALHAGSDADVLIWDPAVRQTLSASRLETAGDLSAWEGRRVSGLARAVYLRGRLMAREGRFVGPEGQGKALKRKIS